MTGHTWALVLAAGEGTRLRSLTSDRNGISVPKQFCSLDGGPSLLELGLQRAARVVPQSKITCVVATQHRDWWRGDLSGLAPENVIEQPDNRGTAAGVLLPLMRILEQDLRANVIFLPSDHFVGDEAVLARVMRRSVELMESGSRSLYLLGITPDEPDSAFGWIVPSDLEDRSVYRVNRFVEKPPPAMAADLMLQGGVWNSFIIAGSGMALLAMFQRRLPDLVAQVTEALQADGDGSNGNTALAEVYRTMESHDFCRDVLQGEEDDLRVLPVPQCGWSDLGTPERVACCLDRWRPAIARDDSAWAMAFDSQLARGGTGPVLSANLSRTLASRLGGKSTDRLPAKETPIGTAHSDRVVLPQLARASR